jgi:transposase
MSLIKVVGVDLAKLVFSIHGVDEYGKTKLRKTVKRNKLLAEVATVNDAKHFATSRAFSAWIGLVPKQYTTGGVARLGRISKRGEKHIRTALIHGARAVMANCKNKNDRTSKWIKDLIERRGFKRACVALAARNARLIWALLQSDKEYQVDYVAS